MGGDLLTPTCSKHTVECDSKKRVKSVKILYRFNFGMTMNCDFPYS